jgi:hypothetical protein
VHWTGACPSPDNGERPGFVEPLDWGILLDTARRLLSVTSAYNDGWPENGFLHRLRQTFPPCVGRIPQTMPMAGYLATPGDFRPTGPADVFPGLTHGDSGRTTLMSDTLCTAVDRADGKVQAVHVRHLPTGECFSVPAKTVIIACDALRSPQLLHASGIQPPALGQWLNDHVMIRAKGQLCPERPLATNWDGPSAGTWWVPSSAPERRSSGQITADRAQAAAPAAYEFDWFVATELNSMNGLTFSKSESDVLGMPSFRVNFSLSATDRESVVSGIKHLRSAMDCAGFEEGILEVEELPAGTSLHYTGSVRLGVDCDSSVADTEGRVWGTSCLYVAGNGAVPTALSCNSTLTAAALAVRTARAVCEDLEAGRP